MLNLVFKITELLKFLMALLEEVLQHQIQQDRSISSMQQQVNFH